MAKGILIKNGGGISLPTLTNEATSNELLVGKELINSEGKVLVGTGDLVELNFDVVGGTTEPVNPKENTIWVETDAEITGWAFSMDEPTNPVQGMVWFQTGASSDVPFNVLKKNEAMIYPISAKQYISGVWAGKNAQTYFGGKWNGWLFYLFNGVIGDYSPVSITSNNNYMPVASDGELKATPSATTYGYNLSPIIDVSDYDVLEFDIYGTSATSDSWIGVGLSQQTAWTQTANGVTYGKYWNPMTGMPSTKTTYQIDISSVTGEWYFQVCMYTQSSSTLSLSAIRLLKKSQLGAYIFKKNSLADVDYKWANYTGNSTRTIVDGALSFVLPNVSSNATIVGTIDKVIIPSWAKTLHVEYTCTSPSGQHFVGLANSKLTGLGGQVAYKTLVAATEPATISLDVSSYNDGAYYMFFSGQNTSPVLIYNIWFE